MGLEGLVDVSAAPKVKDGYRGDKDAAVYRPGTPMLSLRAQSRSAFPTYEVCMWNIGRGNPSSMWRIFEGHVAPRLIRLPLAEGVAGCVPITDDAGTPVRLDYTERLVERQNLGNVRVDGLIGNLPPKDVTRNDWRPYYKHGLKLRDPKVLAELMRRGVGIHPDRVPSMVEDLRQMAREAKAGTMEAEILQMHMRRAAEEFECWRDAFEEAIEIFEAGEVDPRARLDSVSLAQIQNIAPEDRIQWLQKMGIEIATAPVQGAAKEAAPEPEPEPEGEPTPVDPSWGDLKGCGKNPPDNLSELVTALPAPSTADLAPLRVGDVRAIAEAIGVEAQGIKRDVMQRIVIKLGA